ncbi:MAG: endo alpha-1,4 polygalactosaminidase [Noviherbaspirillum sp.]
MSSSFLTRFWQACVLTLSCVPAFALAQQRPPSVAFYYGAQPPLAELQAFDIAVVEPDFVSEPRRHARAPADGGHELYAYVSLGEVHPTRSYYAKLPAGSLRGSNAAWGSRVIDQTAPGWQAFFLDTIIAPLWQSGWRGFFLDTLDSYQLFAGTDAERAAQQDAMVAILREFKRRYPDGKLMINRGFELLPRIAPLVSALAAESLRQGYDAAANAYRPVPQADRDWLGERMREARDQYRLPVVAIDYVDPSAHGARELARATAARIRADGFIPWVADGGLTSLGVGNVELLPRTVLVLVSGAGNDLHLSEAQRFLGIQLNHLGLRYELIDMSSMPLPQGILAGRYAGIVSWIRSGEQHAALGPWLARRTGEGMRVAIFNALGFAPDPALLQTLGLNAQPPAAPGQLKIQSSDAALIGFEAQPLPDRSALVPLRIAEGAPGRSLLRLADVRGNSFDAAAITAWGGYVLAPFAIQDVPGADFERWVVQPLAFLREALALGELPAPDVTTEGGRRMLMVHVDGDGFASRAELPGAPYASEVMEKQFIDRYRLPSTVSVIEGELSASGMYPQASKALEAIARRIYAQPQVEAASHSYSHPFNWAAALKDTGPRNRLNLPGYTLNLAREVRGSMDYVNRLLPAGKTASVFLWSGDCVPPAEAIAETARAGFLNMNGGDTTSTRSTNSWTAIAAQGIRKEGWYQVYAPHQNENVYTNDWTGPFYGFERVIETFELTGAPHRFKPIDIYYHVYSASKPASIAALHRVYQWADAQPTSRVFGSQYIRKVMDFEATTIARDHASGELVVRTGADLRTLRLPAAAPLPALADKGIAGFTPGPAATYLTLSTAETRLSPAPQGEAQPYVAEANGAISELRRSPGELQFALTVNGSGLGLLALATPAACSLTIDGKPVAPVKPSTERFASANQQATDSRIKKTSHYEFGSSSSLQTTRYLARVRCAA